MTRAARTYRGQEFTVGDISDTVECSRRTVRRVLNEQTNLGYLDKQETKNGLANGYRAIDKPEAREGEVELPSLDDPFRAGTDQDESPSRVSSTGFVWVVGVNRGCESRHRSARATLPAPVPTNQGDPPPTVAD